MPAFPFVPAVVVDVPPGVLRYQLGWLRPATAYYVTAVGTFANGSTTPASQGVAFATAAAAAAETTPPGPLGPRWGLVGSARFSAGSAYYITLALGSTGTPYVAYQSTSSTGPANVQRFDGTSWGFVGSAGFSGSGAQYISLALNSAGADTPYVAYKDAGNSDMATVQKFDGVSWSVVGSAGFSSGVIKYTSLALGSTGTPYVAYTDATNSNKATVQKFDGTSWGAVGSAGGFSTAIAYWTSLALDTNTGYPYVAYQDAGTSPPNYATVQKFDGVSWSLVGSVGFSAGEAGFTSLELSSSGTPYIAYKDSSTSPADMICVQKFDGISWAAVGSAGFSAGAVNELSLALGSTGTPYVAYKDLTLNNKATAQMFDGTSWSVVGSPGFSDAGAQYISMGLGSSGAPYVAYQDGLSSGFRATVQKFA